MSSFKRATEPATVEVGPEKVEGESRIRRARVAKDALVERPIDGIDTVYDILAYVARTHGAMAMVHAENADCIEWLTKRLEAAGHTAPRFHAHARPMLVEREATHRAIALSELVDVPILIVHVSGREAVEQIRWARAHGLRIFAETCPQYLFLTAEDLGYSEAPVCIVEDGTGEDHWSGFRPDNIKRVARASA